VEDLETSDSWSAEDFELTDLNSAREIKGADWSWSGDFESINPCSAR
jgi:hypothetical protein